MIINDRRKNKNKIYAIVYGKWYNMMDRCYNKKSKLFKNYGEKGICVCERWHDFELFLEDFDKIDGFDITLLKDGKLSLDKDKKKKGNTIYCLELCTLITKEENNKYKPHQQKTIIGISPNNDYYEFDNQSEFARKHNLRQSSITDCLRGKCKTHKKWKFYYKNTDNSLEDASTIERVSNEKDIRE